MSEQAIITAVNQTAQFGDSIFTFIMSVLVAGAGTALWIRRRISKDSLEIRKDAAEGELIQHLEDERDHLKAEKDHILSRMLDIDKERQEAVQKVGQLTVEVNHLTKQVKHLEEMVGTLSNDLRIATQTIQEFAIENAKLNEKLTTVKEIFAMKCDSCVYKKQNEPCGIPIEIQNQFKQKLGQ